jgi:hypothetical protein
LFGVANAQNQVAAATSAAGKAAKGALASFDKLNVLQQQQENPNAPAALPGLPMIPPELISQVEAFKAKLLDFLQPAIDGFQRFWKASEPLRGDIGQGLQWLWEKVLVPFGDWVARTFLPAFFDLLAAGSRVLHEAIVALTPVAKELWEKFLQPLAEWTGQKIIEGLQWLTDRLNDLAAWIKANPEQFANLIKFLLDLAAAWLIVKVAIEAFSIAAGIMNVINDIGLATLLSTVAGLAEVLLLLGLIIVAIAALIYFWPQITSAMEDWKIFFSGLATFVEQIAKKMENALLSFFTAIEERFPIFGAILTTIWKGILNTFIDILNLAITAIVTAINMIVNPLSGVSIPGWTNPLPSLVAPEIPRLATGAVIPPNAAFAAILGDQRNGTNIEAPESLIRQIVSEEIGKIQADITIKFDGTLAALVRELKPVIDRENVRVGGSLIKSGVTI